MKHQGLKIFEKLRKSAPFSADICPKDNALLTKNDWLMVADNICKPVLQYWDADDFVQFPRHFAAVFNDDDAIFECFARPLWAMAGLVKNGDYKLGKRICSIIKNGVNPELETYWGALSGEQQKIVDMPAIAFFLFVNSELIDREFNPTEKQQVADWLLQINHCKVHENNWRFFPLLVNAILLRLGMGGKKEIIQESWEVIEQHYTGDGWYRDGLINKQRDYYIAWGYHFYSLLWLYIDPDMSTDLRNTITSRAEAFAETFKLFFDETGEAVSFGRSLIYRFAQVAFWSAYELNGLNGQPVELVKSIMVRNLKWWFRQHIFHPDGTFNLGYAYDNQMATEPYSAEGSPYWACKTFVLLLLPENSAFWKAAVSMPVMENTERFIPGANIHMSRDNGMPYLYPVDMSSKFNWPNALAIYQKFVYSTRFGIGLERGFSSLGLSGADSNLALFLNESHWIARHGATQWQVHENGIISSVWVADTNISITSYICPWGAWNIRIHKLETNIPVKAADCGFSIPIPVIHNKQEETGLFGLDNLEEGLFSAVISIDGTGTCKKFAPPPNSNILYPRVEVPYIVRQFNSGTSVWINGFYGGNIEPHSIPKITEEPGQITVSLGERQVQLSI